jgi:hypothetical protein
MMFDLLEQSVFRSITDYIAAQSEFIYSFQFCFCGCLEMLKGRKVSQYFILFC